MLVSKNLNDFIDELIKEKNFSNLDPEVIDQIRKDLTSQAEDRINATILSKIPSDKLDEFEKLLDSQDESNIQKFVSDIIPDLDVLIASELLNFRSSYVS